MATRRGWRERIEPGLYREHRVKCPRSADRRPNGRCDCPWLLAISATGGSRFTTYDGTVTQARAERRRLLAQGPIRPAGTETAGAPETLTDLMRRYLTTSRGNLEDHTLTTHDRHYRLRIAPTLGPLAMHALTNERIATWWAALLRSGVTHRQAIGTLAAARAVLKAGAAWGYLPEGLADRLRAPAKVSHTTEATERVLTLDQLRTLYAATNSVRVETMLRAAAEGALRRGEVIALRWSDIDLDARVIHVRRSVSQPAGQLPAKEKSTKGRRRRRVPISTTFADRLRTWQASTDAPRDGLVWPGKTGDTWMDAMTPTQALGRLLGRAGLVDDQGNGLVTYHQLRHTAASLMLTHGLPLLVVSRILGHANPRITSDTYAHLVDGTDAAAADVFEGI